MAQDVDLIVRNGLVVDGTGAEPFIADIAVSGGRIVAVGAVSARGHEEIDAKGLIITPGFVDIHTHYDGQVTWENRLVPSSAHGVTTVVMGNCGVGFAPCRPDQHEMLIQLMEGVEDLPENMQRAMARQAEAEREKRAKIIHAAGELEASEKLAQAAQVIATAPEAMTLRYLQTLTEIAAEKNSTIVFPLPIDLLRGMLSKT